jgi:hypothetical protein
LRPASFRNRSSMIPKSGHRFSDKIMLKPTGLFRGSRAE